MSGAGIQFLPLGFPWHTRDPFLFCVHHLDGYPRGNAEMGPEASLAGRQMGMDFAGKDGWRMYHGRAVPGFPAHPHRGFETVTLARRGYIDHSDSLGMSARFGEGDAQWMTAGRGIVHSEMFPLVHREEENPVELFQIWLNLPANNKMVEPHFSMLWSQKIPKKVFEDASGRQTEVVAVAGRLDTLEPPPPPPNSWAADADNEVAIWTIRMQAEATWTLPSAKDPSVRRSLYFFSGDRVEIAGETISEHLACDFDEPRELVIRNGGSASELLMLQGRPIGEPVAQHGPFVMNQRDEIREAIMDYQRTQFGGWPWPSQEPVHPRDAERFARRLDGDVEHGSD